jgi:hypothetical protein
MSTTAASRTPCPARSRPSAPRRADETVVAIHRELYQALVAPARGSQGSSNGSGTVINALAMAASYDPDPAQFLWIRLPVSLDTCEVIEQRRARFARMR